MVTALKALFTSKKFWTLILGIITMLGTRYGFSVDPTFVYMIGGLFAVLLGAQGLQDQGAVAAASAANTAINIANIGPATAKCPNCSGTSTFSSETPTPPATPRTISATRQPVSTPIAGVPVGVPKQSGFVRLPLLAVIVALGLGGVGLMSCKPLPVPVSDLIDCVKAEGSSDWQSIVEKLTPDLGDWTKLVSDIEGLAPSTALNIAECVGMELINQYLTTAHTDPATTKAASKASADIRSYVKKAHVKAGSSTSGEIVFHSKRACPNLPDGCNL